MKVKKSVFVFTCFKNYTIICKKTFTHLFHEKQNIKYGKSINFSVFIPIKPFLFKFFNNMRKITQNRSIIVKYCIKPYNHFGMKILITKL